MSEKNGFRPLRSGPRPMSHDEQRRYKELLDQLGNLARELRPGIHHVGWVGNGSPDRAYHAYPPHLAEVEALVLEAQPLVEACNALSEKIEARRDEIRRAAGEGGKLESEREVLDLLPPCRVTSGPVSTYDSNKWMLSFPAADHPALRELADRSEHDQKRAIQRDDGAPRTAAGAEWARIEGSLADLERRGFRVWLSLRKVTRSGILATLTVGEKR
jgi:hypothetical protein